MILEFLSAMSLMWAIHTVPTGVLAGVWWTWGPRPWWHWAYLGMIMLPFWTWAGMYLADSSDKGMGNVSLEAGLLGLGVACALAACLILTGNRKSWLPTVACGMSIALGVLLWAFVPPTGE